MRIDGVHSRFQSFRCNQTMHGWKGLDWLLIKDVVEKRVHVLVCTSSGGGPLLVGGICATPLPRVDPCPPLQRQTSGEGLPEQRPKLLWCIPAGGSWWSSPHLGGCSGSHPSSSRPAIVSTQTPRHPRLTPQTAQIWQQNWSSGSPPS